jgi:RimJ/RimL family protein N-acetyltransferase
MISLEDFEEDDFERFISWIDNEDTLVQFAGTIFNYPITNSQLTSYIKDTARTPLKVKLSESGVAIGHCELNFENAIPRLSRILIGVREFRGKGLGKLIVAQMVERLFASKDCEKVDLNVYDWNHHAIACYKKLGFEISGENKNQCPGYKNWKSINMILTKERWEVYKQNLAK